MHRFRLPTKRATAHVDGAGSEVEVLFKRNLSLHASEEYSQVVASSHLLYDEQESDSEK